jgi:hypothetical protein
MTLCQFINTLSDVLVLLALGVVIAMATSQRDAELVGTGWGGYAVARLSRLPHHDALGVASS